MNVDRSGNLPHDLSYGRSLDHDPVGLDSHHAESLDFLANSNYPRANERGIPLGSLENGADSGVAQARDDLLLSGSFPRDFDFMLQGFTVCFLLDGFFLLHDESVGGREGIVRSEFG